MASVEMQLVGVSLRSVATVIACASVGAYARKQGVLDAKAQKVMDKLVSTILLPALILGKVTPNLSVAGLRLIWPMGVMCIFVVLYGLLAGSALAAILARWHPAAIAKYKGLMMVAIAFPNSFSVPLTLALQLGDHPVLLVNGESGGDHLRQRMKMLFLLSYAIWVFARWSIGYPILSGAMSFSEWRGKVMNPPVVACMVAATAGLIWNGWLHQFISGDVAEVVGGPFLTAVDYAGRCTVPMILMALGAKLTDSVSDVMQALKRRGYCLSHEAEQKAMSDSPGVPCGFGKPGDVELAGIVEASTPPKDAAVDATEEEDVFMPASAYIGVLILRQAVGPLLGATVACWLLRDICGVEDTAVLLVALLQSAGPPMINLSVMAGITGSAETETAKLLLITYAASVATWTASITGYLYLLR